MTKANKKNVIAGVGVPQKRSGLTLTPDTSPPGEGEPVRVVKVTDLRELEAEFSQPFTVEVILFEGTPRERRCLFEGRRLLPRETEKVQLLLEAALPPLTAPAEGAEEARYDYRDPEYLQRKEKGRRQARALALWLAYPHFKELARSEAVTPTDDNVEKIAEFIEGRKLEDDLLEALFRPTVHRVVGAQSYLGFTSGSGSPKS